MTEPNQRVLRRVRASLDGEHEWEFGCECGEEDCRQFVFLTLDAYVALRAGGAAVLAEGHRPEGSAIRYWSRSAR